MTVVCALLHRGSIKYGLIDRGLQNPGQRTTPAAASTG